MIRNSRQRDCRNDGQKKRRPPLNLVLGAPGLKMARDKLAMLAAELDRWEVVTVSADYGE
jgi:hypothetical protein